MVSYFFLVEIFVPQTAAISNNNDPQTQLVH